MMQKFLTSKWSKWSLIFVTAAFGVLPSGCENRILRLVTPLLV
ncbi:MAG: hypothetical protein ACE5F9_13160 [Phycisphaerae bacterium]